MNQADTIKKLRKSKDLSLKELSKLTSISSTMLGHLETGERTGTIQVLTKLANFYDVSVDYITCNPKRAVMIDMLIENLVNEGIIDPNEPLTDAAKETILAAVKLKLENLN